MALFQNIRNTHCWGLGEECISAAQEEVKALSTAAEGLRIVLLAAIFFLEFAICQANNVCRVAVNRWQQNYVMKPYMVSTDFYFSYKPVFRLCNANVPISGKSNSFKRQKKILSNFGVT